MASPELTRVAGNTEQAITQITNGLGQVRNILESIARHDVMNELPAALEDAVDNRHTTLSVKRFRDNVRALDSVAYYLNGITDPNDASKTVLGHDPLPPAELTRLLWIGYR